MAKKYYILNQEYPAGPVRGDVLVWEGEVWNSSKERDPVYLTRYLWDFDGFYFLTPKEHLVELVAASDLEDPKQFHTAPHGKRRIWNMQSLA
jgi:hypothetical protein